MAAEKQEASSVWQQIRYIKAESDRSTAYAALLHLQRTSSSCPQSMNSLAAASPSLISLLLSDIGNRQEDIAALSLKCLGFFIYHPLTVPFISDDVACLVLDSLVKLIMATRMKAICNLGVWCISVQQLPTLLVDSCLELLVGAIVYAIDNPFGSLSTTFEATQAAAKLCNMFHDKMRAMSNIWVPPIYRRLLSTDKRERDMAERCLFKTKSIICPAASNLSKVIAYDLKQNLIETMMNNSCDSKKRLPIIQAWAWYVCILGHDGLHDRHLVNNMLKFPERTFADFDVQVAWESLIDGFLPPQTIQLGRDTIQLIREETGQLQYSTLWKTLDNQIEHLLRRLRVLMKPLLSIISSKYDTTVILSCLNTWRYLLYKLDILLNHPSVVRMTFWSVLEMVFSKEVENGKTLLWNSCLELFAVFVSTKDRTREYGISENSSLVSMESASVANSIVNSKPFLKDYPLKWLPWDINDLHLHFRILSAIIRPEQIMTMNSENKDLTVSAAIKIFRLLLKGVHMELKRMPARDDIQVCSEIVCKFMTETRQTIDLEKYANKLSDLECLYRQVSNVLKEELEHLMPTSVD